ncbi:MAG TPA: hypothetical protein DDZ68_15305 [Parvularcula sp.]|nr:hypothetical protein [Parvularcula sp.]HBS33353.1 hypothetical protein [Parvularcula sp.]HBS35527.1 hypothetical protein [Parvularcula sp.]
MGGITQAEAKAWASLAALCAIFFWFQMRMMDGWAIVDQSARDLLSVYVVVLAMTTIAGIVIGSIGARKGGGRIEADERDLAIEARANQNERFFIIAAINVLIWQALMEGAFAGHALPRIDLGRLSTLFFLLFAVLFGGEIVKRLSTIWLYRTQAGRG